MYFFLQELKTCAAIINIFHMIPAASSKLIEPLILVTLSGEKSLFLEVRGPTLYWGEGGGGRERDRDRERETLYQTNN